MPKAQLTVLLVEDDHTFKAYALAALRGHNNITAVTKTEAMAKFNMNNPDITFLDINLPDGSGLDLLQEMKNLRPNAFIVMVTGSKSPEDVAKAREHHAEGYILKPFNVKKVQEFVAKFRAMQVK